MCDYRLCPINFTGCLVHDRFHVAGVDNVFAINPADDFAKVDQHARPRNAKSK